MPLSQTQIQGLQLSLQQAVVACSERCLYHPAKWAAELLDSLAVPEASNIEHLQPDALQTDPSELCLEQIETPRYLMAKAFFDCHEFQRCAATLLPASALGPSLMGFYAVKQTRRPGGRLSQRSLFLGLYALFTQGERQKTDKASQILDPSDTGAATNEYLPNIKHILERWFSQMADIPGSSLSQGWLEYLYGMVLARDEDFNLARHWLLKSVEIYPWNWGAWQELGSLTPDADDLISIAGDLKESFMMKIFAVCFGQGLCDSSFTLLEDITQLQTVFPRSSFLQSQRAMAYYRLRDFETAQSLFSDTLISYPRYFDFLDSYSNMLVELGSRKKLASLAQYASSIDRYRPETCYVVASYYALWARHEDSITYLKRALRRDRSFASAWTLLGHEYRNVGNVHAALSSYLRAIDLNKRDYRAYIGLGQTYDSLKQPAVSLEYYDRVMVLRPWEIGMWMAVAGCLMRMSDFPAAANCLIDALDHTKQILRWSLEQDVCDMFRFRGERLKMLYELSGLHDRLDNRQEATLTLEQMLNEAVELYDNNPDDHYLRLVILKTQLLLAERALKDGDRARARRFAEQWKKLDGRKEEAQEILDACAVESDASGS
ncbi:cell division cycle protein-like protein 23 [Nemania sp. FL0916]|nr:cell division cycle protein-like protein 23 [Nemania sp. FL0916]